MGEGSLRWPASRPSRWIWLRPAMFVAVPVYIVCHVLLRQLIPIAVVPFVLAVAVGVLAGAAYTGYRAWRWVRVTVTAEQVTVVQAGRTNAVDIGKVVRLTLVHSGHPSLGLPGVYAGWLWMAAVVHSARTIPPSTGGRG